MMMIREEPTISVGIMEGVSAVRGHFNGSFRNSDGRELRGPFTVAGSAEGLRISTPDELTPVEVGSEITCSPSQGSDFLLRDVVIGIQFHWERKEDQRFEGSLKIVRRADGKLTVINIVSLEQYLRSVISSEMSGASPTELLRAHAITSRSWLGAMLERKTGTREIVHPSSPKSGEIIRWYTREDHDIYDVCADDHCQRYQGITKIVSPVAGEAVDATRGKFLVYDGTICDARYYKACGGMTDEYRSAWEDRSIPYLTSVSDAPSKFAPVRSEDDAHRWIESTPRAYCNTSDSELLQQILPSFDQETVDFFRWEVNYRRTELEEILRERPTQGFSAHRQDFGGPRLLLYAGRRSTWDSLRGCGDVG